MKAMFAAMALAVIVSAVGGAAGAVLMLVLSGNRIAVGVMVMVEVAPRSVTVMAPPEEVPSVEVPPAPATEMAEPPVP